jgi:hypothetical protein
MSTPSDIRILDDFVRNELSYLNTCMPAEVLRVNTDRHKRQFVDVLPSLKRHAYDEDDRPIVEELPMLYMVPVAYPQGGGCFISVPLAVGDIVTLVFAQRSLDYWIETARKNSQRAVDPGDVGMHVFEGAIAFPCGPAPRPELLADVHAENLVIGKDGGVQIHITPDGTINLGGATLSDFVALASKVDQAIATLKTAIGEGFTAVGAGSAASGAAGKTKFDESAAAIAGTGSTTVKSV